MIFCCCRSQNLLPPSASPILPKPPQGSRRRLNKTGAPTNQSSAFSAFETESTTVFTVSTPTATTATPTTVGASVTTLTATTTANTDATTANGTTTTTTTAQQSNETLPVPTKRRTTTSADSVTPKDYENTTPVSNSVSFPLDKSSDDTIPRKPVPIPRRNTLERNLASSSPLALSSIRSPNTSTTSLPSMDVKEETASLQVQQQQSRKESSSGRASSSSISAIGSVSSTSQSKESASNNVVVIPIAMAIQETVNASFKGKTYENL